MKTYLHAVAGTTAFLLVASFWTATVVSEVFLSAAAIAVVKHAIVQAMLLLIPCLLAAGASGFSLSKSRRGTLVDRKKRRMPFIALNGLLVLLPSALFLDSRAAVGAFDATFYAVQAIEMAAGALQLALLGMNLADGLRLSGRFRSRAAQRS